MHHNWQFDFSLDSAEGLLELGQQLELSSKQTSHWKLIELQGAVLGQYLIRHRQRLDALLNWFYHLQGFGAARERYFTAASADLGATLISRQGNATSLALLLRYLASEISLNLDILLLPSHCVLRYMDNDKPLYIDALTGEYMAREQIHAFVRGELGNQAQLKPKHLQPAKDERIATRLLNEIKAGFVVEQQFGKALICLNWLLARYPKQVQYLRERAYMAQQLGASKAAAQDLQAFVDSRPKDPMLDLMKMQIRELKQDDAVYH
ncbi:tetratricopeptide repeat protein [Paraferrimonas sedimenticola]|uniref:Protein SirB1 N-terminal domain-containing protein n=1 Tax=Paraferrimonas sedimenticola TaxID=375674 RepID=A0AA37RUK4_9GAMM|nr:tetratricopeptide repeat protein [Paraferrimonas sedimenticola]GLP95451.1 hypothetical protein GCM10007895_07570 [Paraferrimonas sedimenticola]